MERWVWQGIQVELPPDWEMLQFSCNPLKGRCAFADRYQFRLELDWLAVDSAPDVTRALSDYQARLAEEGAERVEPVRCAGWRGLFGVQNGEEVSRFLHYLEDRGAFVEIVFAWPGAREPGLERAVLQTVRPGESSASGGRCWRAFGMELIASPGLALDRCVVRPAHAEMVFVYARGRREERFARRGMVSDWLDVTIGDWLRRECPSTAAVSRERAVERCGHRITGLSAEVRGPGLFGKRRSVQTAAWLCPGDGRLYSVACTCAGTSAGDDPLRLAGSNLRCCQELPTGQWSG